MKHDERLLRGLNIFHDWQASLADQYFIRLATEIYG